MDSDDRRDDNRSLSERMAALPVEARSIAALAVASRFLPFLTAYIAATGESPGAAVLVLDQAWDSLVGGLRPEAEQVAALFELAPPPLIDVPESDRQQVRVASEAFLALMAALHHTLHGQSREAVHALDDGRLAALHLGGQAAVAGELRIQWEQIRLCESAKDVRELVRRLRPPTQKGGRHL